MERAIFDENQPTGKMSLLNLRNTLRALHQMDMRPLRPRASFVLDDFEYSTDANAQASWSGAGVTISISDTVEYGNYAMKALVDGTGDREITQTVAFDLSAYKEIRAWIRQEIGTGNPNFYIEDSGSGHRYWEHTISAASDFQSDVYYISDGVGDVDLSDIVTIGFSDLIANEKYTFDRIKAHAGLAVAVSPSSVGGFYEHVYVVSDHVTFAGGASPAVVAPSGNPRIDVLYLNRAGTLV